MRYSPRELTGNVNISKKHPLKELFSLLLSLLGILLFIYIILGFAVDIIAPKLPESWEKSLGRFYEPLYASREKGPEGEKLKELLEGLVPELESPKEYTAFILKDKRVNALALPGGKIAVFSGLVKEIESENELAFVLAHELGHYAGKDHLKAMGRGMVFFFLSNLFLGQDNSVSNFIGNSLSKAEMKFSQKQETNADSFALDLLYKKYGHAGGAIDFLRKMEKKEKAPKFFYFFASHPHSGKRIRALRERIAEKGYPLKNLTLFK